MKPFLFADKTSAALAPMAGAADSAMREVCMGLGASYCFSEMISAKALTLGDKKTPLLLKRTDLEQPFGVQLFGSEPEVMAQAAKIVVDICGPDFLDINMGCPAPKITGGGAGSALMKNIPLSAAIVRAVCGAVDIPVTVKMRGGWERVTAAEHAVQMEQSGASAVTVHPRTRAQMFSGAADLSVIRAVKAAVKIPVIGNGDIRCGGDAKRMLEQTGCDTVMVGRGALGNPFIFAEIRALLRGESYSPPDLAQRIAALTRQVTRMCEQNGEHLGMLEARKQTMWSLKGFRGAALFRTEASALSSLEDFHTLMNRVLQSTDDSE